MLKRTIVILCFVLPTLVIAKPGFHIYAGLTRTMLRQEGGKSQWGKALGCGLEFSLPKNTFLGLDGLYLSRKASLTNRMWPTFQELAYSDFVVGRINLGRSYIQLVPKIGFQNFLFNNKISFKVFIGYALDMYLDDASFLVADKIEINPSDLIKMILITYWRMDIYIRLPIIFVLDLFFIIGKLVLNYVIIGASLIHLFIMNYL